MRITENTSFGVLRDSIRRSRGRMENLQTQSATLRKLNQPSDDPIGASKVLEIRTDKVNNDQFQMNARMAEAFLNNSDQALSELNEILIRVKEIAINQSSAASSNEDTRLGVAEEVDQLYQQAVAVANRRIGDRYLFGGYKTSRPPVDPDGKYQGDPGQMMVEIAKDVYIAMNVPGVEAFNTQPRNSGEWKTEPGSEPDGSAGDGVQRSPADLQSQRPNVNAFNEIQNLRVGLLTGDLDTIRNTLDALDEIQGRVTAIRSKVGSRLQGIQSASQALERHNLVNAQLSSTLEDADMAQVVSDLAKEETVFRSALSSSTKLIQPTLLDFLK